MLQMLLKFSLVGLSGVGVNMLVYAGLIAFGLHYLPAAAGSFVVAVTNNYIWNARWTFRGRGGNKSLRRKYFTYLAVSVFNLGVNLLVLRLLVETFGVGKLPAQVIAIGVVSLSNFIMNYAFTFGEPNGKWEVRSEKWEAGSGKWEREGICKANSNK